MKSLKIVGIILGVLVLVYLLLCVFGPKKIDVERSIDIMAQTPAVHGQVADFKNWPNWSPWHNIDSTMKVELSDPSFGQGATMTWTSENAGNGGQEILEVNAGLVRTKLEISGWQPSYADFMLEQIDEKTAHVTWTMKGDPLPFLLRGMLLVMGMNEAIGKDYEKGLANLKTYVESNPVEMAPKYNGYEIQEIQFPATTYAAVRNRMPWSDIQNFFAEKYGMIQVAMEKNKLEAAGAPCGLYYEWDETSSMTDLAAAIPVNVDANLGDPIEMVELSGGKALLINYYGGYAGSAQAHYAMDVYLKVHNLNMRMPVLEEYVTDPGTEPDSNKWLTRIYYFVE